MRLSSPTRRLFLLHSSSRSHLSGGSRPQWRQHAGNPASRQRDLVTLAIETSCDDTCVAVLEKHPSTGAARLHYNEKVTSDNRAFGGVHPATAVTSHTQNLARLVRDAVPHIPAGGGGKPDFVSVTRGPGMTSNLSNGLATAKGLAVAWGVPLLAVNHMQAHALTPRLVSALELGRKSWPDPGVGARAKVGDGDTAGIPNPSGRAEDSSSPEEHQHHPAFPFLSLLVSGGHTMLVLSRSLCSHKILVPDSGNLAIGDMLDKCARDIVPPELLSEWPDTMYGAALESFAFPREPSHSTLSAYNYNYTPPAQRRHEIAPVAVDDAITLKPPLSNTRELVYNLTGFGTQVSRAAITIPAEDLDRRRALARACMRLAFEHLASRIIMCISGADLHPDLRHEVAEVRHLVVAGGVARNQFLVHVLRSMLDARGGSVGRQMGINVPPPGLCTDNAAMIAWTGLEMWEAGWESDLTVQAVRKWPLDPESERGGILGEPGWLRGGA